MMHRIFTLGLLLVAVAAAAGDLTVVRGYRQVWEGDEWPPAGFFEGGFTVNFVGEATLDLAFPQPGVRRVDEHTFTTFFDWSDIEPVLFTFLDGDGITHEITVNPIPDPPDPAAHELALVNVTCEPAALWDPVTGIYCYGESFPPNWNQRGDLWERTANFAYHDPDDQLLHDRPIGLRIHGESSRAYAQKSLRFYFDHHGLPETVVGSFFGEPAEPFARLIVRSADAPDQFFCDPLACELFAALGHEVSRWRPVAGYLNNEYWGLYHLRERLEDEWAELTVGLTGDYDMIKDGQIEHGSDADWLAFLADVVAWEDPEDHAFLELVEANLDVSSWLDWQLVNITLASADNGGARNLVLLRPEGGVWRFVMWDEDLVLRHNNRVHDFFTFFASSTAAEFAANRPPDYFQEWGGSVTSMFTLFAKAMANPVLRRTLRDRWQEIRAGELAGSAMRDRLDAVVAAQMSEADAHMDRWAWPETHDFEYRHGQIRWILGQRDGVVDAQCAAFLAARMLPVELTEWSAARTQDGVALAWRTEQETDTASWTISRANAADGPYAVVLEGIAAAGDTGEPTTYAATDSTAPVDAAWYRLTHVLGDGTEKTHPWTVGVPGPPPTVVLNEFLASNDTTNADETGAFEDWVELFNPADEPVDLGGYGLTDDLAVPGKWHLPAGTVIEAGGHLLVWCDDDPADGPLHATFKLSASGEELGLFRPLPGGGYEQLDAHVFGPQLTDISEGRLEDGHDTWTTFTTPTPGQPNGNVSAAPPAAGLARDLRVWPNPANPGTSVVFRLEAPATVAVAVYDLAGRHVRTLARGSRPAGTHTLRWDGRDDGGAAVAAGVYLVAVADGRGRLVERVALVK